MLVDKVCSLSEEICIFLLMNKLFFKDSDRMVIISKKKVLGIFVIERIVIIVIFSGI